MWNQQVEVPHHHLIGPLGVSPHNTPCKRFVSWLMNDLALYIVGRNRYCSRFLQRSESLVYNYKITMPTITIMTITVAGCFATKLFRYKSLQVATSRYKSFRCNTESIRYTHKVDSLHILGRFASNSRNPKVDSLHKPIVWKQNFL